MKSIKKVMLCMTVMTFCLLFANVLTVSAAEKTPGGVYFEEYQNAKGEWKNYNKKRISTYVMSSIRVDYANGDKIANLKVNKKSGLKAAVTYEYDVTSKYEGGSYAYATINLFAEKAGKYTVSFNVLNSAGQSRGKYSITVQAVNSDDLIKKATFGKQTVASSSASIKKGIKKTTSTTSSKVSGTAGKLKITPNSQYKITGLVVATVDKNGMYTYKKVKNGKSITLSKNYARAEHTGSSNSRDAKKNTYIYISYKDKFNNDTHTYSVSKSRGIKEIKHVFKDGRNGKKSTEYLTVGQWPSDNGEYLLLWQY